MLEQKYRDMLIKAAESEDTETINRTIETIKLVSPNNFFFGDKDPELEKRVFYHRPFSTHWSGKAIKDGLAY